MLQRDRRRMIGSGLILCILTLAPAPPPQQPAPAAGNLDPAGLAQVRAEAGAKAYDLAWLYYSENRIDADKVYRWSKRAREADRDSAQDQAGRVTAAQVHLDRMNKLEAKIARIRKLGFGNSLDVAEVEFYRKEAEFWLAEAKAR